MNTTVSDKGKLTIKRTEIMKNESKSLSDERRKLTDFFAGSGKKEIQAEKALPAKKRKAKRSGSTKPAKSDKIVPKTWKRRVRSKASR